MNMGVRQGGWGVGDGFEWRKLMKYCTQAFFGIFVVVVTSCGL